MPAPGTVPMSHTGVAQLYYAQAAQVPYLQSLGWVVETSGAAPAFGPGDYITRGEIPGVFPQVFLSPLDYGAVGDGATDDTAAIRALLAAIPRTTDGGLAAATIDLGPYTYRITDTIDVSFRNLLFQGRGIGNGRNVGYGPSTGSTLRWDGVSGRPMIRIVDAMQTRWDGIYFQGNADSAKRPSALIRSEGGYSGGGGNMHHTFRKCRFGSFPWSVPATTGTSTAGAGLEYAGTNANNDRMRVEDCQFDDCTIGLKIANTQSVWGSTKDTTFTGCGTGIDTSSGHTMFNTNFQGCGTDLAVRSSARVTAVGWGSENSGRLLYKPDGSGQVSVLGGLWLLQTAAMQASGRIIEVTDLADGGGVKLDSVTIRNEGGLSPRPKLYVRRGATGGPLSQLIILGCEGVSTLADLDVQGGSGGPMAVTVDSRGLRVRQTLTAGQSPAVEGGPRELYPLDVGESNLSRAVPLRADGQALVSGYLCLTYFTARKTETITRLRSITGAAAAAATPTLQRLGVYSVAGNGDLTLVAAVASDTATRWRAANTEYLDALAASWSKVDGVQYAIGALIVSSAAAAQLVGATTPNTAALGGLLARSPRLCGLVAGQTDLPSAVAAASVTSGGVILPYIEMVP